jgi:hypothetical protein
MLSANAEALIQLVLLLFDVATEGTGGATSASRPGKTGRGFFRFFSVCLEASSCLCLGPFNYCLFDVLGFFRCC